MERWKIKITNGKKTFLEQCEKAYPSQLDSQATAYFIVDDNDHIVAIIGSGPDNLQHACQIAAIPEVADELGKIRKILEEIL